MPKGTWIPALYPCNVFEASMVDLEEHEDLQHHQAHAESRVLVHRRGIEETFDSSEKVGASLK